MENLDKEVTSKDKKEVLLNAYQKFTEFLNAARELTVLFEEMEDCNEYIANDYAEQALPEHLPMMLKTDAILTKEGGMTSHAAILARNLKKPAISGIPNIFKSGDIISLDATKGFIWKSFQNVTQPNEKENLKVAKNILKHFNIDANSITSVKQNFLQNMQSWNFELNDNYKKISSKKTNSIHAF